MDELGHSQPGSFARIQAKKRISRAEYEAEPKYCEWCGTNIPFEKRYNRFCSQTCSATHNNQGITRHIKGSKVCECGRPEKPKNKYCSECANSYSYKRVFELEQAKTDQLRRKLVIEQRGHRCERCGLEQWMGEPIPLELDHISGDTDDNSSENLRMLCPNCHAQTETYKGANKGKSGKRQQMRRKRYADGLTW